MKTLKLDPEEKRLLEELERDEWKSDITSIQKIALEEGIPYQTLISSVLHKFVNRKIKV